MSARPDRLTRSDIMSTSEASELTGFPVSTLAEWSRQGTFPHRKRGRRRLHLRWEVEDWIARD